MSIDPATLTAVSIATSVLGAGVSIIGQGQAASAQKASLEYQAAVNRNNAIIAERNAADARARGEETARQQRIKTSQLQGRQRAVLASNGIVVDEGSALDITEDTAALGKLDELNIRNNAEREALGFEAQGMNFTSAAGLNSLQASNTSATLGQIGTALGAIGAVADKWYRYSSPTRSGPYMAGYSGAG